MLPDDFEPNDPDELRAHAAMIATTAEVGTFDVYAFAVELIRSGVLDPHGAAFRQAAKRAAERRRAERTLEEAESDAVFEKFMAGWLAELDQQLAAHDDQERER